MITQSFDLNLIPDSAPIVVHCDQYDHGEGRLIANLYDESMPYYADGSAMIQGEKPDGKGFAYDATISGNTVTADLTDQMTAVAGNTLCQIVVTESTGRTGSFIFILEVQKSALPSDTDMSESDYQAIQTLINLVNESVSAAAESAEDAEAWAVGQRSGVDVPSTDETYQNNSKYYAEQAQQYAQGGLHYKGSCLFADIPASGMNDGDMWNIEDDFTTDARFKEGAGIACVAGTNIAWNDSKWDLLTVAKSGVQSFNGRTGIVTPQAGDYDLTDMGDIVVTSATDGQVLTWDDTSQKWVNRNASGGSASLAGLDDVSLNSPTNGQVLKYNSTTEEWENANESGGGSGDYIGLYGDTLVDADLNNITTVGNYYNDGTVTVSHYPSNAIITATSSFRLTVEKMGDSASTNLRQTYILDNSVDFVFERHRTNGSWSSWQKILTSYSNIGELDNVDISSPTDKQVLTYNLTTQKWENANAQGGGGDYVGLYGMTEIQSSDGQGTTPIDLDTYTAIGNYFCNGKGQVTITQYTYYGKTTDAYGIVISSAHFLLYVIRISDTCIEQRISIVPSSGYAYDLFRSATLNNNVWTFEYWHRSLITGTNAQALSLQYGFTDITLTNMASGDFLVRDSSTSKWVNKPVLKRITQSVSTSGWTADTTSQSGTTLYKKSIDLSHVYITSPIVDIGAAGVLPTTAQQEAYDLLQYVTVDNTVPRLYLYSSAIPSTAYYINITGAD